MFQLTAHHAYRSHVPADCSLQTQREKTITHTGRMFQLTAKTQREKTITHTGRMFQLTAQTQREKTIIHTGRIFQLTAQTQRERKTITHTGHMFQLKARALGRRTKGSLCQLTAQLTYNSYTSVHTLRKKSNTHV